MEVCAVGAPQHATGALVNAAADPDQRGIAARRAALRENLENGPAHRIARAGRQLVWRQPIVSKLDVIRTPSILERQPGVLLGDRRQRVTG